MPLARGWWPADELVSLRRVVEMAGMLEYCDFDEQSSHATENGRIRPDLLVRLPGGRTVVIDARAPLEVYLDAQEATAEATREQKLADHSRQVRDHLTKLGANLARNSTTACAHLFLAHGNGEVVGDEAAATADGRPVPFAPAAAGIDR